MSTLKSAIYLAVLDPGQGEAPPGSDKITTVVNWVAWIVFAACVVGLLICAAKMAIQHRQGGGGEHGSNLGWVMGACILGGTAGALVGALV
ncbi:hypothetical protein [Micromonospora sp.]|uniref:hypothetical protein n=1 Tax=Micromonospora sp. TaxID=1876 RepID=UPI003B3AEFF2